MKRFNSILLTPLIMLAISSPTFAGTTTSKIVELGMIPAANLVWVQMAGPITTPAACSLNRLFAISLGTDGGRSTYKMVLAAQVQNLPVTIYGTGSCKTYSGIEDILYIWYDPPTS
ncbi:MAG: hypothetical protein HYX63_00235 [Gammaproteobacteria bacterium]|nr:hypothetical protein [Gammaproteobacteria bacterium]